MPLPKWAIDIHVDACDVTSGIINISNSGQNSVIIGVSGQLIRVWYMWFIPAGTTTIQFMDGPSTNLSGPASFTANEGMILDFITKPWFTTSLGNDFIMNLGTAVQVAGTVYFTQGN